MKVSNQDALILSTYVTKRLEEHSTLVLALVSALDNSGTYLRELPLLLPTHGPNKPEKAT